MTRRIIAVVVALGFAGMAGSGYAQNVLRPGTLPDVEAKPIEEAGEVEPASAVRPVKATSGGPVGSSKEARLLLNEAMLLSQSSKSVENFTEVVELCKQANEKVLAPEEAKYGRELMSWALNQRGEAYAAQASEFMAQGSEKEAAKLDRLALEDFKAAVKQDPKRWKAIHNRGVSYGVLGLYEDAIADFTRVVELKPGYLNAWFNRAELHLETGKYKEAAKDYSEAIRLKGDDPTIFRQRGRAYAMLGRYDEALADFDSAVGTNASDVVSLVERGKIHCRLGDWEAAASDFRTAVETDPESAEAYRDAAWLMATCPQVKYRNSKMAIAAAQQAVELAKTQGKLDFSYYDTLAAAFANASRFAEAEQTLNQVIAHAPLAEAAAMKKRLALYAKQRPYRDGTVAVTAQPASTQVQR